MNDNKGNLLADLIQTLGMVLCNEENEPTFQSNNRSSIINITFATQRVAAAITNWGVFDIISLSDHRYIRFYVNDNPVAHVPSTAITKIFPDKLRVYLESNQFPTDPDIQDVEALATGLSDTIM